MKTSSQNKKAAQTKKQGGIVKVEDFNSIDYNMFTLSDISVIVISFALGLLCSGAVL